MKLIDISHILDENTPKYPGDYKLKLSKYKAIEKDQYCSYLLTSTFHTGTHIDLPRHLIKDERLVPDFSLDKFIGEGVLLDVRGENEITMKPCYKNMVKEGSIVLLFTGFDTFYNSDEYFANHPEVSKELGDFLVSKRVKMLGMDMPSPDFSPFSIHKTLLSNDILILENLTNLECLLHINDFEVSAFPLKVSAEASFVRAVCRVD